MRLLRAIVAIVCAGFAAFVGQNAVARLPNYTGYYREHLEQRPPAVALARPRHVLWVVVDGLRADLAQQLRSAQLLAEHGSCVITQVDTLSVSRPSYAAMATGLEQDRSGARNNDLKAALPVQSVFDVARMNGLSVDGRSELTWWQELFPNGFSEYTVTANVFDAPVYADLTLFHPVDTDETAHDFGTESPQHKAALALADVQLMATLSRVDWSQDFVLFTSDHGHVKKGGHGGMQPEVREVWTCVAGKLAQKGAQAKNIEARHLGPMLSMVMGLAFPNETRADGVERTLGLLTLPEDYALDRVRALNAFPKQQHWDEIYAHARRIQMWKLAAAGVLLAALAWRLRVAAMLLIFALVFFCVHQAILGDFDATAINRRELFVPRAAAVALLSSIVLWRGKLWPAAVVLALSLVAHIAVFGWPLGFPIPGAAMFYYPFIGSVTTAAIAVLAAVTTVRRGRR